jgi:hypothetical protein
LIKFSVHSICPEAVDRAINIPFFVLIIKVLSFAKDSPTISLMYWDKLTLKILLFLLFGFK